MHFKTLNRLHSWDLHNKRVFLRADLNVPLHNATILDESRIHALLPTLDYLIAKGAHVTIATHLGNPKNISEAESIAPLRAWFQDHSYHSTLLENLRSMPGEQRTLTNSADAHLLAQELAQGYDYYINDAFGALHRNDTSLTLVPQLFDKNHTSIGFLIEKELDALQSFIHNVQRPYYVFLGGAKQEDKLKNAHQMLARCDGLFLMPTLSSPFVQASRTKDIQSLVNMLKHSAKVFLPVDYIVSNNGWQGPFYTKKSSEITEHDYMIAIGEQTVATWKPYIQNAQTIFFNGPMGRIDIPATVTTLHELLQLMATSSAHTAIGGGNSLETLRHFGLEQKFDVISTGGGATLTYLSHHHLPALQAVIDPSN